MPVAAAIRLTVALLLSVLAARPAVADQAWYDDRQAGGGCCGPAWGGPTRGGPAWGGPAWVGPGGGSPAWGGYAPYPNRPFYPPPGGYPPGAVPPRAWAPPVIVVPVQPPVTYSHPPAEFVYWCDDPKGYYPNVTNCNGPWREQSATMPR